MRHPSDRLAEVSIVDGMRLDAHFQAGCAFPKGAATPVPVHVSTVGSLKRDGPCRGEERDMGREA
ncbi:hypothetical protein ASG25_08340 [Rhizobium sp. Leaf384]|nr:hypothetical protein ASG58_15120 [Rhizobium sp. Leaf383]KQS78665.1 hypothetical protein ASG25_08340 [Rhizobium sp. Leaf384]